MLHGDRSRGRSAEPKVGIKGGGTAGATPAVPFSCAPAADPKGQTTSMFAVAAYRNRSPQFVMVVKSTIMMFVFILDPRQCQLVPHTSGRIQRKQAPTPRVRSSGVASSFDCLGRTAPAASQRREAHLRLASSTRVVRTARRALQARLISVQCARETDGVATPRRSRQVLRASLAVTCERRREGEPRGRRRHCKHLPALDVVHLEWHH